MIDTSFMNSIYDFESAIDELLDQALNKLTPTDYDILLKNISICLTNHGMWNPETDACVYCMECEYFLNDYWNCEGDIEPCVEFVPKIDSEYKKVEVEVEADGGET